jgi:hypothetical protein
MRLFRMHKLAALGDALDAAGLLSSALRKGLDGFQRRHQGGATGPRNRRVSDPDARVALAGDRLQF